MRLINRDIQPSCVYCKNGSDIGQSEIICIKRGIVTSADFCSKFRYEPTKREPVRPRRPKMKSFTQADFEL